MKFQSQVIFTIALGTAIFLNILSMSYADVDWQGACIEYKCQCQWKSGKKSADCKNTSLSIVPTKLSSEIQVLDLSNNVISELRRDEFAKASLQNLHKLFLKSCTLIEVNGDAFKGLEILIELDLSNNNIKVLVPETFKTLMKLRTVILNSNEIEKLDDKLFDNLPFLKKIELKDNHIRKINFFTFMNVPELQQIYLDNNKLQLLRKETFQKLVKLTSLSLTMNPWNCTCELKQFRDFTIDRNLYTQPTECKEPLQLQGKFWSDIPSDDFACRPKILSPRSGTTLIATSENATLSCRVRASPTPDIDWTYNKRSLNSYDQRISIKESIEFNKRDLMEIFTSDLIITGLKQSDKGSYTCIAKNRGGIDEADISFDISQDVFHGSAIMNNSSNILLITACIAIGLFIILFLIFCILCCYCKKLRKYNKNSSTSDNGLVISKLDQSHNDSILEGGSVILELQKSLLTEVNPVEKPPRRADVDTNDKIDFEDGLDVKKSLLEENMLTQQDDETRSLTLSDARSRTTFVDDGYGTNLPPDLLAFSSRFPQSPSIQSSMSNIHDGRLYSTSPLSSPGYQQNNGGGQLPTGFRTLQHPKTGRTIAIATSRSNSPFTPAPLLYPAVVLKQGYVTIPRKPRTPSWTPSATTNSEYAPSSPTSNEEPVYDNLGLRTTISGNSILNLNKLLSANNATVKYTMKDRPLPATPIAGLKGSANNNNNNNLRNSNNNLTNNNNRNSGISKLYEPIQQDLPSLFVSVNGRSQSDTEPLYNTSNSTNIISGGGNLVDKTNSQKVPPRVPPKPKKRISTEEGNSSSTILLSNSQFENSKSHFDKFEDENEDGTEV